MEGERHDTKRQGEADGERSAEEAMVEGRDGRTKEARARRTSARTGREQTAPAGHFETFAKTTVHYESVDRREQQLLTTAPQAPVDRSR